MQCCRPILLLIVSSLHLSARAADAADSTDLFESKVRPILVQHCHKCHGPEKQQAGLRLDTRAGWQAGGKSGPAIIPGKPDESLLIKLVRHGDAKKRMPADGKLADREIAALSEWVSQGATDPRDGGPTRLGGMSLADARKWWSLQPLNRPVVPKNAATIPIDAFILEKLVAKKLSLSPLADKRTLLRRATYDLIGMPPSLEEVDAFLKDDSPQAFAKVVDRLLASPHYGERWGRHWLDLIRYADSAGENSDHPLPHAWRYRNWVVEAYNRDQPYDEFLREQIAGDILAKDGPPEKYGPRVVATGFLAIARRFGHDIDKDMHLTHEDTIDTLGKSILGLTIGCARCHDHKYDPITAQDYYGLYGIFDSTRFSFSGCEAIQQPRDLVPLLPPSEWDRVVKPYRDQLAALDAKLRQLDGERAAISRRLKAAAKGGRILASGDIPDGGERPFAKLPDEIEVKAGQFLQLSVTPRANHGADSTLIEWEIAEVGGKRRTWNLTRDVIDDLLAGNPHPDGYANKDVWWFLDARDGLTLLSEKVRDVSGKAGLHAWRNGDTPSVFANSTKDPIAVWTRLPARSLFVHPAANGNVAVGWLCPIDGKVRITGRIKDVHPGGPDGVGWIAEHFTADLAADLRLLAKGVAARQEIAKQRAELTGRAPKQDVAYAVMEGSTHNARIQVRGDPEKPGDETPRRWLEVLGGDRLPKGAGSGRLELAGWLTSKDNPLTARVLANRIWQHHFGKGLVQTPNDFGSRGIAPTHPALLDWLAAEFVESGWSIKAMHRRIVLSATYQQASAARPEGLARDPNNEGYWRFERRRLTAEEIRDTLLADSGQLDRKPGGAHPFPPESTWNFTQHNPFNAIYETDKRSVYLMILRNRRHPFLGLFDGADPNASTPQRQMTTVPTQALYFMNDPFFHAQADKLAARVLAKPDAATRIDDLFRIVFQRPPSARDRETATAFLKRYAAEAKNPRNEWAALVRVLLASNEFLYLD